MYIVTIETDNCEGCGECVEACPAQILSLNDHKAQVSGNLDECLGCEACVTVCESGAISVQEY
ncbi:MAG: 4Fe-4S binding protein [Chloroflexi bacterium]|nr:4Fe-4S binding protein [Chloroflexota bacterium]